MSPLAAHKAHQNAFIRGSGQSGGDFLPPTLVVSVISARDHLDLKADARPVLVFGALSLAGVTLTPRANPGLLTDAVARLPLEMKGISRALTDEELAAIGGYLCRGRSKKTIPTVKGDGLS
ncbi:MAG: hypothetical protein ACREJP_06965 [Candidatus Methylomirabilales bacterium]